MQICESILQAAQDKGRDGIKVTTLMNKANLPHPRLTGFINKMMGSELINKIETDGKHTFIITEKGILYLAQYKKFSSIAESFGFEL
ncbi:hypothetical protein LCGC14_1337910 [marine sediment metagenome]|uniref:ArnR1-like winged helix-turn-helix domain-containing protein n=1 Tax=marine sediment metagenome TaxID=412755 RepID=A0A0F9L0X5_9ZZZZ